MDLRVGDKYRLVNKIGGGAFGDIYQGTDLTTGKEVRTELGFGGQSVILV